MSRFRFSLFQLLSLGLFAAVVVTVLRRSRRVTEFEAAAPRTAPPTPEPVVAAEPEEAPVVEQALEAEPAEAEPEPAVDVYMAPAEPIVAAEPEPEPEPEVVAEPEPAPLFAVEPEPTLSLEHEPVADTEPDPGYWHVPPTPPADWSDPTLGERHSA